MRETNFTSRELSDSELEAVSGGKQRPLTAKVEATQFKRVAVAPMPRAASGAKVCGPDGCK